MNCLKPYFSTLLIVWAVCGATALQSAPEMIDFTDTVIVVSKSPDPLEAKAATVLQEEIHKRVGKAPLIQTHRPKAGVPMILLGQGASGRVALSGTLRYFHSANKLGSEGFALSISDQSDPIAGVLGADPRGAFYGVGRLLRKMELRKGSILIPSDLEISSTPTYPLRGHQLGYRPKTNAYDAWTPETYDQYIRELALFGSNCIEIVPPVTDDEYLNEHMKLPPLEMMAKLTEIIDSYGMDVWIWYPNMGDDFVTETGLQTEIAERHTVFSALKRVDHILVPGGDPGNLHPNEFFPWMDRVAPVLNKYHPNAKIWVSPQAMHPTREWLTSFYEYINKKPNWLGGVAFAPWIKTPISDMRDVVRDDIPLRRYPDITHNVACQYPVQDWDFALAVTLHRECYNPRPIAMKAIHNRFDQFARGSITYTEGIHDDVNKFVWGDQDWDPNFDPTETLQDYARFLISPEYVEELAQGIFAQEESWIGPLATNPSVEANLQRWLALEASAPASVTENYRFQMGLLRACYDAYVKKRLLNETELQRQCMEILKTAPKIGSYPAIEKAEMTLLKAKREPIAQSLKNKCVALADSLFEKIGSQTSVVRHGAQKRNRGGFLDGIDEPLNDIAWLREHFEDMHERVPTESGRLKRIDSILNRANPGPGGFYDNMGDFSSHHRIVYPVAREDDPGTLISPRIAFNYNVHEGTMPFSWRYQVGTIYETPLSLKYENLDPKASYSVRITYTGNRGDFIRLDADRIYPIHETIAVADNEKLDTNGLFEVSDDPKVNAGDPHDDSIPTRQYPIPQEATRDGKLTLTWKADQGERGSQVSEIWIIKN